MEKKHLIYVTAGLLLAGLLVGLTRGLPDNAQAVEPEPADTVIQSEGLHLSAEALALAHIVTSPIRRGVLQRTLRLYGSIQTDETRRRTLVSQVGGRIESLAVNYVGQSVVEGEALARIYSPELYNAQQELVEARRPGGDSSLLSEAVRQRLRHLKLTDSQIAAIDREGSNPSFTYLAPYGGTVVSKAVSVGDYVESGSPLFELADLTSVWAVFEAYEKDLSFLHVGDALAYEVPWLPGERFSGQIAFISPWVDSESRTVEVRLRTENRQGQLKPGMTAVGMATASLGEQGLIVPREAVLWTGVRSGVWTKEGAVFKFREVELGTPGDQGYVVLSGLEEGEEVVTQGAFAVDAAAQLASSPSMLSPSPTLPSAGSSTGHSHHHHGH